jgi:hypothetical protein
MVPRGPIVRQTQQRPDFRNPAAGSRRYHAGAARQVLVREIRFREEEPEPAPMAQ